MDPLAKALADFVGFPTKLVDESGRPTRFFHGTTAGFDQFDPSLLDPHALFGKGIYLTSDSEIAGGEYNARSRWTYHPTQSSAQSQPGRVGFVWKDENVPGPDKWIASVEEPGIGKAGYAQKGLPPITKEEAVILAARLLSSRQHWTKAGYLTKDEADYVRKYIGDWRDMAGNFRLPGVPFGSRTLNSKRSIDALAVGIAGQPYNVDVMGEALRLGLIKGSNVRPAYVATKEPLDLRSWESVKMPKDQFLRELGMYESDLPVGLRSATPQDAMTFIPMGPGGSERTTELAKRLGYDAVVHEGGIHGGRKHTVAIALEPHQVVPAYHKALSKALLPMLLMAMFAAYQAKKES